MHSALIGRWYTNRLRIDRPFDFDDLLHGPTSRSNSSRPGSIDEERRLAHVGVTRARDRQTIAARQ